MLTSIFLRILSNINFIPNLFYNSINLIFFLLCFHFTQYANYSHQSSKIVHYHKYRQYIYFSCFNLIFIINKEFCRIFENVGLIDSLCFIGQSVIVKTQNVSQVLFINPRVLKLQHLYNKSIHVNKTVYNNLSFYIKRERKININIII